MGAQDNFFNECRYKHHCYDYSLYITKINFNINLNVRAKSTNLSEDTRAIFVSLS